MYPKVIKLCLDDQFAATRSSIAETCEARCAARFPDLARSGWWIGRVGQGTSNSVTSGGRLLGISDVHVGHPENREIVEGLQAESDNDWLIVAGDVAELISEIEWALRVLRDRFHTVIWVPGNHELWTLPQDSITLCGQARYQHLVDLCRGLGMITPHGANSADGGAKPPSQLVE
jgi:hypothetical protein